MTTENNRKPRIAISHLFKDFIDSKRELRLGKKKLQRQETDEEVVLRMLSKDTKLQLGGFALIWGNKYGKR